MIINLVLKEWLIGKNINQIQKHIRSKQAFRIFFVFLLFFFENENGRTSHSEYYLPKDYIVKINGKNVFDQPINVDIKT